jgi:hypothetical protein
MGELSRLSPTLPLAVPGPGIAPIRATPPDLLQTTYLEGSAVPTNGVILPSP